MQANLGQGDERRDPSAALRKVLDTHGYGFHYATLRTAETEFREGRSAWTFLAAEVPVEAGGVGTRVDFVMQHRQRPWFLVGECKRVNPALARWGFARAPYVRRNRASEPYIAERVSLVAGQARSGATKLDHSFPQAYHVGVELRTSDKGDSGGQSRNAIEEAASQVCRGMNGLVGFFGANPHLIPNGEAAVLLPVVFTTAEVWETGVDLGAADAATGKLPSDCPVTAQPWIAFQYHLSPGLKHRYSAESLEHSIERQVESDFIRTIPVVSATGIASFLNWSSYF